MKNMFIIRCKNIDFFISVLSHSHSPNLLWDRFWVGLDSCLYNPRRKVLHNISSYLLRFLIPIDTCSYNACSFVLLNVCGRNAYSKSRQYENL